MDVALRMMTDCTPPSVAGQFWYMEAEPQEGAFQVRFSLTNPSTVFYEHSTCSNRKDKNPNLLESTQGLNHVK